MEKSLAFYKEALNLEPVREKNASDGSFKLVYLGDGVTDFTLELTWLRDRKEAYDLGECEFHLAFHVDDFDGTHKHHEEMGCICYENPGMGIYFIKARTATGWKSCLPISREYSWKGGCFLKELSILLMGMSLIFMFVIAVVLVLYILAYWMIFRKAGEAGWKALIPFYGTYIEYKLFWNNRMFVLWLIMALIAAFLPVCVRSRRHGAQLAYFGVFGMHILISVKMSCPLDMG